MLDFVEVNSWFDQMFQKDSDKRFVTFKIALNLLSQQPTHRIVETGTIRVMNDWGAGYSTVLFGNFVKRYGGHVTTIDIEKANMDVCRQATFEFKNQITYIVNDSLKAIPQLVTMIDLLYLDSLDTPLTGDATEAQTHNLNEFMLAEHLLHEKSIVLIDDNDFENGGKPRKTKVYLEKQGWRNVFNGQQTLWIR